MIRQITLLVVIASLGACVSFLPEPEAPNALYRLGPVEQVSNLELDRSVVIRQPDAARVLSGVEIAARDSSGAVLIVNGVEWADRAPRLLQLHMLDLLSGDGEGVAVLPESGAKADYQLSWHLTEFSLSGRTATAKAEFLLIDTKTREALAQDTASVDIVADGGSNSARAEAMAEAGRRIVEAGARFLANELDVDTQI